MASNRITQEISLQLSAGQSAQALRALEDRAKALRTAIDEAVGKGDKNKAASLQRQLTQVNSLLRRMQTESTTAEKVLSNLNQATPRELKSTLAILNRELSNLTQGTQAFADKAAQIRAVKEQMAAVTQEVKGQSSAWEKLKERGSGFANLLGFGMLASAEAALNGAKQAVEAYASMQEQMAGVSKYSGLSEDDVKTLNDAFKEMDTRTSREDLNRLAQDAGRLGKTSVEEILGFVKAADQINVALDDLGDGATLTLSKLTNIFGIEEEYGTEEALLRTGSVINELSQNCSASAPYIAEFTSRLGAAGSQAGMTIPQIMALGAVMDEAKVNVEAGSTAISKIIVKLYQEPAKYAKAAGLDVQEFYATMKKDANEGFLQLIEALNKKGDLSALAPIFKEMGESGQGAQVALATLAGNIDKVRLQQEAANEAFREGTSISKEAEIANNTVAARLEKAKQDLHEVAVTLGKSLMPLVTAGMKLISGIVPVLTTIINVISQHKAVVMAVAIAWGAYQLALAKATITEKTMNVVMKVQTGLAAMKRSALLLLTAAQAKLTGNTTRATQAMKAFNAAQSASKGVIGIAVAAIGLIIEKIIEHNNRLKENRRLQEEHRRELEEMRNQANNISQEASANAAEELARLEALYKAAKDETKAKNERIAAAQQMIKLYPTQLANMSAEQIALGNSESAYNKLTAAILRNAEAKAAAKKIEQNMEKLIQLKMDNDAAQEKIAEINEKYGYQEPLSVPALNIGTKNDNKNDKKNTYEIWRSTEYIVNEQKRKLEVATQEMIVNVTEEQIKELEDANKKLSDKYGAEPGFTKELMGGATIPATTESGGGASKPATANRDRAKEIKESEKFKSAMAEIEADRNNADAAAEAIYRLTGDWASFQKQIAENEMEMLTRQIELYKSYKLEADKDAQALQKKINDREKAATEKQRSISAETIAADKSREETQADLDYATIGSDIFRDEEGLQQRKFAIKVKYLRLEQALYEDTSEEWHRKQVEIEKAIAAEQLRIQQDTAKKIAAYSSEYTAKSARVQMERELEVAESIRKEGLISEEDYQRAVADIRRKYADEVLPNGLRSTDDKQAELKRQYNADVLALKNALAEKLISQEDYNKKMKALAEKLRKDLEGSDNEKGKGGETGGTGDWGSMLANLYKSFQALSNNTGNDWASTMGKIAAAAKASFAVMSAAMDSYSQYSAAVTAKETARITAAYDRRIELAKNNSAKQQRLEEAKNREIAAARAKASKESFALQVASAIASTALNAIMAYQSALSIPGPAGLALAPIAAALAIAAGMVQVATIKKQQEAAAISGYSEGGFTKAGAVDEPAGIVHAGEWVASQKLVNNPRTRPIIDLLEQAQRTNSVPTLTAGDVSRSITAPMVTAERATRTIADQTQGAHNTERILAQNRAADKYVADSISRLNEILANGISANVSVSGRHGIDNAQKRYNQMIKNKKQ